MSPPWQEPAWREEALAWIEQALGGPPSGPVEQPHVRPWSTVLRVPTEQGDLWFKANAPVHRFEAGLAAELAGAAPDRVAEVVAADAGRGWFLTRDAGTRLRDLTGERDQLEHWARLLPLYAELQLAVASQDLLALGVPDLCLATLPGRFATLLEDEQLLCSGEDALTAEQLDRARASVAELQALCDELAAYGIPETIQHDDLHDGQVFVAGGRYRVLDWGDACVSHPFHTLLVTLRFLTYRHGLEPGGAELRRLRDAYLEPFGRDDLAPAVDLAYRTGTLARALAWHRFVSHADAAVGDYDADRIPYGVRLWLQGGPIGTWDPD